MEKYKKQYVQKCFKHYAELVAWLNLYNKEATDAQVITLDDFKVYPSDGYLTVIIYK